MKKYFVVIVTSLCALGCPGEYEEHDEGQWCVYPYACEDGSHSIEGVNNGTLTFEADQPICVRVKNTREDGDYDVSSAKCTVEIEGDEVTIHSNFVIAEDSSGGCGLVSTVEYKDGYFAETHCNGPILAAGEYTIQHGDESMILQVPGDSTCLHWE